MVKYCPVETRLFRRLDDNVWMRARGWRPAHQNASSYSEGQWAACVRRRENPRFVDQFGEFDPASARPFAAFSRHHVNLLPGTRLPHSNLLGPELGYSPDHQIDAALAQLAKFLRRRGCRSVKDDAGMAAQSRSIDQVMQAPPQMLQADQFAPRQRLDWRGIRFPSRLGVARRRSRCRA